MAGAAIGLLDYSRQVGPNPGVVMFCWDVVYFPIFTRQARGFLPARLLNLFVSGSLLYITGDEVPVHNQQRLRHYSDKNHTCTVVSPLTPHKTPRRLSISQRWPPPRAIAIYTTMTVVVDHCFGTCGTMQKLRANAFPPSKHNDGAVVDPPCLSRFRPMPASQ